MMDTSNGMDKDAFKAHRAAEGLQGPVKSGRTFAEIHAAQALAAQQKFGGRRFEINEAGQIVSQAIPVTLETFDQVLRERCPEPLRGLLELGHFVSGVAMTNVRARLILAETGAGATPFTATAIWEPAFDFVTMGEIIVLGNNLTPTWTEGDGELAFLWVEVPFDGSAVTIHRDDTLTYPCPYDREYYWIRRYNVQVQNSPIRIVRTP